MSFKTRIRNKRDTASNWETNNPVLLDGELIVVNTNAGNVRFKIGDGTKTYTQLPFQDEAVYNALSGKANAADIGVLEGAIEALRTEMNAAFDECIVAEGEGELTTELPEMFGGRTAEEYALKTDLENVSGLPEGSSPNQYLVTDGEGNAKWEDKLCWSEMSTKEVLPETALSEPAGEEAGLYVYMIDFVPEVGREYIVVYNGAEYKTTAVVGAESGELVIMGNLSVMGDGDNTGEPFVVSYHTDEATCAFGSADSSVTLSIYTEGETIHPIDKKYLPSVLRLTVDWDSGKVTSDTEVADALDILGQTDFVTVICAVKYDGKTYYGTLQSIEYNAENASYTLKFSWYDGDLSVRVIRELGYVLPTV